MPTQDLSSKTSGSPASHGRDARPADTRPGEDRLRSAAGRDAEPGRNAGRASDDTRQATE